MGAFATFFGHAARVTEQLGAEMSSLTLITGARPGFARQVPSARHPEGEGSKGAWLAWLPPTLCLQTPLFAVGNTRLAGGLVRAGIEEIEEVSHG
jgi:hypothetical protein